MHINIYIHIYICNLNVPETGMWAGPLIASSKAQNTPTLKPGNYPRRSHKPNPSETLKIPQQPNRRSAGSGGSPAYQFSFLGETGKSHRSYPVLLSGAGVIELAAVFFRIYLFTSYGPIYLVACTFALLLVANREASRQGACFVRDCRWFRVSVGSRTAECYFTAGQSCGVTLRVAD